MPALPKDRSAGRRSFWRESGGLGKNSLKKSVEHADGVKWVIAVMEDYTISVKIKEENCEKSQEKLWTFCKK